MQTVNIDIETFSSNDIRYGVHKYVEAHDFEILLISYKIENKPIVTLEVYNKTVLNYILSDILISPKYLKTAYNAMFEITCLNKFYGLNLDLAQWRCTMGLAAQVGLPFGLGNVAKALNIEQQKDTKGTALIKYFSCPCKPTKANNLRTRNFPSDNPEKWDDYKAYNKQDVLVEYEILKTLSWYKVPDFEKPIWQLDQIINNRGVKIDKKLVDNAIVFDKLTSEIISNGITDKTNIVNPKSLKQLKDYILGKSGISITSLSKEFLPDIKASFQDDEEIFDLLEAKEQLSITSTKKFNAIQNSVCEDGTVKGLFQYYGANRTGRWAGRNVQLQNLKRNTLDDLDFARNMVLSNNLGALQLTFNSVGEVLSNLIRTSFVARPDHFLIVSDFSSIEARIIAWIAKENWRLEVFKGHGKIYEASASMMFKIPIENITKELRSKGKIAELALGYQGALGALQRMGGAKMGLTDSDMLGLVKRWRIANPRIVKFWEDVQNMATETIRNGGTRKLNLITFSKAENNLLITLPSGRHLVYIDPKIKADKIYYKGVDQITKKWGDLSTYGGKFVENIVQAIARDVLADSMLRLHKAGYNITMHVHDEIVIESLDKDSIYDITKILEEPILWAPDLILKAESFTSKYYKK